MSARAIASDFATLLIALRELEKADPEGVDQIVVALVAHIRSWRPESVSPLGTLPEPGEVAHDPRAACRLCRNLSRYPILGSFDAIIASEYGLADHGVIDASGLCELCALGDDSNARGVQ